MTRARLYVSTPLDTGSTVVLDRERSHYVARVLRLRKGDAITVFDGSGGEFGASIAGVARSIVKLEIGGHRDTRTESRLRIHLAQAVSRAERMDWVVQKATELGVKRISPVLTEFGIVKLDATRAARRRDHWQQIAAAACEQSGRTRPPLIESPLPLCEWLDAAAGASDHDLILEPGATTALVSIAAPATKVCLLIGPEGGFSSAESEASAHAGFRAVSIGPRVLRTETAAVVALAIAQSRWGDLC